MLGMKSSEIELLKYHVKAGGGEWLGIQETIPPGPDLVLFYSPQTRSTLALPVSEISIENVSSHIARSNRKFQIVDKPEENQ